MFVPAPDVSRCDCVKYEKVATAVSMVTSSKAFCTGSL